MEKPNKSKKSVKKIIRLGLFGLPTEGRNFHGRLGHTLLLFPRDGVIPLFARRGPYPLLNPLGKILAPGLPIVEAGDKSDRPSLLGHLLFQFIPNFIDGFQTIGHKGGTVEGQAFVPLRSQFPAILVRIGSEPLLGTKAGLEGHVNLVRGKNLQPFFDQTEGLPAMAIVGVFFDQHPSLGDTVEGHHQCIDFFSLQILLYLANAIVDKGTGAVKADHKGKGRDEHLFVEADTEPIENRCGGALRILRKQRNHDPRMGGVALPLPNVFEPGVGEQKGFVNLHLGGQVSLDATGKSLGVVDQGKALPVPNPPVGLGTSSGAGGENQEIEDNFPNQRRCVHHPRIPQKLPQIDPDIFNARRRRRTQLNEKNIGRRSQNLLFPVEIMR